MNINDSQRNTLVGANDEVRSRRIQRQDLLLLICSSFYHCIGRCATTKETSTTISSVSGPKPALLVYLFRYTNKSSLTLIMESLHTTKKYLSII